MRLTSVLLLASLLQVSAAGFAQKISLSEKNASLTTIFSKIKSQIGYDFVADGALMSTARPVSIRVQRMELAEVLKSIFEDQPLTYEIQDKMVVVLKKETSILDRLHAVLFNIDVKGLVVNEKGEPMAGASVSVVGRNLVTRSASDGSFYLLDLTGKETLITNFTGYKRDTLKLNSQKSVVIALKPLVAALDDVTIVSSGYQDINKDRATGSFGIVTAKDLAKFPTISLLERLQGLVPGVNISTKTTAGQSRNGTINIRGISTIVGQYTQVSVEPLLVIDGFPSQVSIARGALDLLNPDDIEQITFLKDAAASSIWGIQAANGVIVITTKKGKPNSAPSVNFSTTYSFSAKPKIDYGPRLSIPDFIQVEKELIEQFQIDDATPSNFLPPNNTQAQTIIFRNRRGEISEAQMNAELAALGQFDNKDELREYLLQKPQNRQYNLSISGGGMNSSYYMSGYYYTDDRVYKSNQNKGYSINAGSSSTLFKGRISLNASLVYSNTTDKTNPIAAQAMSTGVLGLEPYDMLTNPDGSIKYYDVFTVPSRARAFESRGYLPFRYSPIDELNYNNTQNIGNNLSMNLNVNGKITPWLSLNVSGNVGRNFNERETYQDPESYESRIMVNRGTSVNSNGILVYGVPLGGRLSLTNALVKSYNLRGQLNVNKNWNNKHEINAVFGNEIREVFNKNSNELRYGYDKAINAFSTVNPTVTYLDIYGRRPSIGATTGPVVERTTRALSYYANAAYTYNGRYTVSGSARFDDYNLLGVDRRNRAIPLWSAGLSWNIKKEELFKDIAWLNNFAARFTYGFTGNAPQGYAPVTIIDLRGTSGYSSLPSAEISRPARENLAWETTKMLNYGIEFSMFNNRLSGTLEYYKKHTSDVFYELPINSTYGFSSTLFNAAELDGHGVDLGITFVPVRSKNLNWSNTVNLSYNTNIVRDERFKLPIGNEVVSQRDIIYDGYPTDFLFSYKFAGLDNKGETLIEDPNTPGKIYNTWDFIVYDLKEYSGRIASPWFGAYSSNVSFKGLTLGFQLQYQFGGVFRKPSVSLTGTALSTSAELADRWRKPGDESFTNVPGINANYALGFNYGYSIDRYANSDLNVRSRSNIKLQQIRLSYAFPQFIISKLGVKALSLSAVCRNLGMLWAANKENMDPDYLYSASGTYQLAPVRNYSLQLNLSL